MRAYNKNEPLFSLHIPKSGGQSFRGVLRTWFGKNLYFHYFDEKQDIYPEKHNLKDTTGRNWQKSTCVHGHFNASRGAGVYDYYPEAGQFITIMRDPFELHVSHYFYIKRLGDNAYYRGNSIKHSSSATAADFLKKSKSYLLKSFPFELTMDNFKGLLDKYFVYIGIKEDLQVSIDILARKLGFPTCGVETVNVSKRDEEVPGDLKEEFIRRHPLEYAIYDFARQNYKNRG
jgi:hypothetical protein